MRFFLLAVILWVFSFPSAKAESFYGYDAVAEKSQAIMIEDAVSSAIERMAKSGLSIINKNMVVSERKEYIVISFVEIGNVRGGGAHLVYDPKLKKIVFVLGEQ